LATGRAVGNSAPEGENWPAEKLKDTATGESRESWPEGRTEDAMPGESRGNRPTKSLRREIRPCEIVTLISELCQVFVKFEILAYMGRKTT
jgi:hypothetical protein